MENPTRLTPLFSALVSRDQLKNGLRVVIF
uniref:Uncharacterized protein n=1 Tax=Medicago truncatula TaxID=3880 RepID=I3SX65_MEDTR|nr:unknown [Medicago truncatula]